MGKKTEMGEAYWKSNPADPASRDLTLAQYKEAFRRFKSMSTHRETELRLEPFLTVPPPDSGEPPFPWIRAARNALQLKTVDVAARMGISRKTYTVMELAEPAGNVTIADLKLAAKAMDCELVYAIRPKERVPFARRLWDLAWPACIDSWWVRSRPARLKSYALAAVARDKIFETEFRRAQGWSERYALPATRPRRGRKTVKRD